MTSAWPQKGWEGARHRRNCQFLGDIEPWSKKPAENWTFSISFMVDVALANSRADLQDSCWILYRSNMHFPKQFHGDANLRKTT